MAETIKLLEDLPTDLRLHLVVVLAHDHLKHLSGVASLSSGWHRLLVEYLCSLQLAPELLRAVAPGPAGNRRACLAALQRTRGLVAVGGYNSFWNAHAECPMAADGPGCERSAEVVCVFRDRDDHGPSDLDVESWPVQWPTQHQVGQAINQVGQMRAHLVHAGTLTLTQFESMFFQVSNELMISYRGEPLDDAFTARVAARFNAVQAEVIALSGGGEPEADAAAGPSEASPDVPAAAAAAAAVPALASSSVWEAVPWCPLPPTAVRRADLALASGPEATLFAVGGREGTAAHASVECLALPRQQLLGEGWATVAPMAEARAAPIAAVVRERLLVAGGGTFEPDGRMITSRTAEAYDRRRDGADGSLSDAWSALPPMHEARCYAGSAVLDESWYALGGRSEEGGALNTAEAFDAGRGAWRQLSLLHFGMDSVAGAVHRGRVLAVGVPAIESFDPREGRWRLDPTGIGMVAGHGWWGGCAHVEGDTLYLLGGSRCHSDPAGRNHRSLDTVWIFDLRRAVEGGTASGLRRKERLQVPRWCAAASVVALAC